MSTHNTASAHDDASLVREIEAVYAHVASAASGGATPERAGVLNSLRLMLEPSVRAARLLLRDDSASTQHRETP
jgi:hypothetical protein